MAAVNNPNARGYSSLPEFTVPGGKELWELGKKENWDELEALLRPFDFGSFWVVNEATENHLAGVRAKFDDSCGTNYYERALHRVLPDEDNSELFEKLLALGVNPDLPDAKSWRPSHFSAHWARPKCARALSLCRPSLTAPSPLEKTVSQLARDKGNAEVIAVWEKVEKEGFPPVAKLAYLKEWAALQNLCRRRVVPQEEARGLFEGKNAAEWAKHHGERGLAKELQYLLNLPSPIPPLAHWAKSFIAGSQTRLDALSEQLALALESLSTMSEEIAELKRQDSAKAAEISKMKQEGQELKAALARKDDEITGLNKSVMALNGMTDDLAHEFRDLSNFLAESFKPSE